jgi:DNA-binding IclR family transcriptional regulator
LQAELLRVRERGYAYDMGEIIHAAQIGDNLAYDMGEIIPDLRCVAAPVRNYTGKVIAAISMSVPAYRFERSHETYRSAVVHAGKLISRHMGCAAKAM